MSVRVEHGRFPLVRIEPVVGPQRRAGAIGPLYHLRPLLEELRALTGTRCRLAGASTVVGGIFSTWRASFQVVPVDVDLVVAGLQALLVGDGGPLRDYLSNPPSLTRAGEALAPHGRQPG